MQGLARAAVHAAKQHDRLQPKICGMRQRITPQLAAHADVLLWLLAVAPLECAAGAPPLPSA